MRWRPTDRDCNRCRRGSTCRRYSPAPLNVSTHVGITPDGVALSDGRLSVTALAAARINAAEISAVFAYEAQTLHLLSTRASFYGGTWSQTGKVTMTNPPIFDLVPV